MRQWQQQQQQQPQLMSDIMVSWGSVYSWRAIRNIMTGCGKPIAYPICSIFMFVQCTLLHAHHHTLEATKICNINEKENRAESCPNLAVKNSNAPADRPVNVREQAPVHSHNYYSRRKKSKMFKKPTLSILKLMRRHIVYVLNRIDYLLILTRTLASGSLFSSSFFFFGCVYRRWFTFNFILFGIVSTLLSRLSLSLFRNWKFCSRL